MVRAIAGPYLKLALGFERVGLVHGDRLVYALAAAERGEARVILAVRHAYGDEPQLFSWVVSSLAPKAAKNLGVRFSATPHAVFAHGYEVPRWGGPLIRFLLPRVGAMPIHHDRLDVRGLSRIREAIVDGPHPVAIAPEGQVSYTSDAIPHLEPGVFGLGFGAAERIAAAGRPERVIVLPISNHYRYGKKAAASLESLVARIEVFAGVDGRAAGDGAKAADISGRLSACREALLRKAEGLYCLAPEPGSDASARIAALTEAALSAAERLLGIGRGAGDHFARLYRVRREGWDRIYLAPGNDPRRLGPLDRAVADRTAGEAWYAMRHMEFADLAWYLRSDPPDGAPFHGLAERAQNLWDLANRLAGGTIAGRLAVRPKRAIIDIGEPIDLSARLGDYATGRKKAIAAALADLHEAFDQCIKETRDEKD